MTILLSCFQAVYNVTKRKYAYQKTADFFAQEEEFNVMFFGSSHMLNSIFPMKLWNNYGIVSYNLGTKSESLAITYYNIQLALKYTKPKVIVVDTFITTDDDKIRGNSELSHDSLDAYPMSYIKYLAIEDLFPNDRAEYLFDFSLYHSRWDELIKEDFVQVSKKEKGAETRTSVVLPNKINNFSDVDIYKENENVNMQYLRKIIEYCKEKDIEILLTYFPYPAEKRDIGISKYVQKIADEYDVNYINFLSMNVVDYNTDCYDSNSHLNPSGARKVTEYLGQYIMENYDIPDQRQNEAYSFWYQDYDEYIDLKIENLEKNKKNLNNYLMLLYDEEDIKYEIKISTKRKIEEGSTLKNLLENIGNNYQIDDSSFEKNKDKTIKITTWDNRTGEEIDTVWF